jgi:hypothetical protein
MTCKRIPAICDSSLEEIYGGQSALFRVDISRRRTSEASDLLMIPTRLDSAYL